MKVMEKYKAINLCDYFDIEDKNIKYYAIYTTVEEPGTGDTSWSC